MTEEQFDQLVAALERKYQNRQPALARRSVVLALCGYLGLAFFLLAGLSLAVGAIAMVIYVPNLITIKLGAVIGIPAIVVTWAIVRGLWVRLDAPTGLPVTRKDSPALFGLIKSISKQAGGVTFDHVLLTGDLNAAVVQVPRLGVFGWYKTYLLLGVPLMDAMAPDEFTAVLAHEFAHLSHQHGRLGSWLYRLRISWVKVMSTLAQHGAPRPVIAFIDWFWPRFNASAFVLSRAQEYQADAFAAKVTSAHSLGFGLQRLVVESRRLDDGFWSSIGRETNERPKAPEDVFHRMQAFLGTAPDPQLESRWLKGAMAMKTGTADTHPGLKDRLAALGVPAVDGIGAAPPARASDSFLAEAVAKGARDHFSRQWLMGVGARWEEDHRERRIVQELLAVSPVTTRAGRWQAIRMRARLYGLKSVQPDVVGILAEDLSHPGANFFRGTWLAEDEDPAAIEYLERASARPDFYYNALSTMAALYTRLGTPGKVTKLKNQANYNAVRLQRAQDERSNARPTDTFLPANLDPDERGNLLAVLARHPEIKGAWIARKKVIESPSWPGFVMVLEFPKDTGVERSMMILRRFLDESFVDIHILALLKNADHARTAAKIMQVEGSLLLQES